MFKALLLLDFDTRCIVRRGPIQSMHRLAL
jgi:hypothetical protein